MTDMNVHFSSATDDWATPQDLFDKLHKAFNFQTDVCASATNAKCPIYFDERTNGLIQSWTGVCWMNPPYGREIGDWMAKAYASGRAGATVVCLVPSRTDTQWWHNYAVKGEIYFIPGRLKFGTATASAPFPSAIVTFRPTVSEALK